MAGKLKAVAKSADAKRAVDEWVIKVDDAHRLQSEEASTVEKAAGKAKARFFALSFLRQVYPCRVDPPLTRPPN